MSSPSAQSLLDTPPEVTFDALTKLASRALSVPISLISILDTHRQFFKSQCGLTEPVASARETPLTHSFCQHVVARKRPLIVEDARTHDLVRDNLAVADLGVIAYLGVPLFDSEGTAYGAFCVICREPRKWTEGDVDTLLILAAQVMSEIDLRMKVAEQAAKIEVLHRSEQNRGIEARADRHDLRTPLNAMLLGLQGARMLGDLNEDQDESLKMAERNGKTLAAMIDQLLDIATVDGRGSLALSKKPVLPSDIVCRAIEQTAALVAEKGQQLQQSINVTRPIEADYDKIVRVLVNLLA